jgi:hypothetical protein
MFFQNMVSWHRKYSKLKECEGCRWVSLILPWRGHTTVPRKVHPYPWGMARPHLCRHGHREEEGHMGLTEIPVYRMPLWPVPTLPVLYPAQVWLFPGVCTSLWRLHSTENWRAMIVMSFPLLTAKLWFSEEAVSGLKSLQTIWPWLPRRNVTGQEPKLSWVILVPLIAISCQPLYLPRQSLWPLGKS